MKLFYFILFSGFLNLTYLKLEVYPQGLIYYAEKEVNGINMYDLYSETGELLFIDQLGSAYSNTWDWIFLVNKTTKVRKAYNFNGTTLLIDSIESSKFVPLNNNRIAIKKKGKWGFYDKKGILRINHNFDNVSNFNGNLAAVKMDTQIFLIDTNGVKSNIIYSVEGKFNFNSFDIDYGRSGFYSSNYKIIEENDKKGVANLNNEIMVPIMYDGLFSLKEHFQQVTVQKDNLFGVISFSGNTIIPIKYKDVFVLNNYLSQ